MADARLTLKLFEVGQTRRLATVIIHYNNFVVLIIGVPFNTCDATVQQIMAILRWDYYRYQRVGTKFIANKV